MRFEIINGFSFDCIIKTDQRLFVAVGNVIDFVCRNRFKRFDGVIQFEAFLIIKSRLKVYRGQNQFVAAIL